jgi:hypothetical protein
VLSSTRNPVSAKQKLSPLPISLKVLLGLIFLCTPFLASAEPLEEVARVFTRKIALMLATGDRLSVIVHNLSALSPDQLLYFSQTVENEFRNRGHVVLDDDSTETVLKIGLSQNLTSLLIVGELVQGGKTRISLEHIDLAALDVTGQSPSKQFTLSSELVWKQWSPILDLRLLGTAPGQHERLAVLTTDTLSIYEKKDTGWTLLKSFPLRRPDLVSRDPRGELFQITEEPGNSLVASFPMFMCFVTLDNALNPGNVECNSNPQKDLVGSSLLTFGPHVVDNGAKWDSSHNYFSGAMFGESGSRWKIDPFYSAAFYSSKPGEAPDLLVAAGVDGQARVLNHDAKVLRTFSDWGSELTTAHSSCDDGWYVLAGSNRDWTGNDRLRAFQIEESSVRVFEQFVELPGPILSLGSEQVPAEGEIKNARQGAIAVVRNLKSGAYEAYRISIACSR